MGTKCRKAEKVGAQVEKWAWGKRRKAGKMEVPVGPQARLGIPPCLNSHARGLFSGHQSFLEGVPPLYTSNHGGETVNQRAFQGLGTRVLIEFPGAPAPVFLVTSVALFYWPLLTRPWQVPTGKEGCLLSEKEDFFYSFWFFRSWSQQGYVYDLSTI